MTPRRPSSPRLLLAALLCLVAAVAPRSAAAFAVVPMPPSFESIGSYAQGHFLTTDPVDDSVASIPHTWNQYGFVRGNPLGYVDPSGESALDAALGVVDGFGSSFFFFGLGRQTPTNADFAQGQALGDGLALAASALEIKIGAGLATGGGAVTATGVGAIAGVPAAVAGTALAAHGTISATVNLKRRAYETPAVDATFKPTTPNQLANEVKSGRAPKDVKRVDHGHLTGQEPHVHYNDNTASTRTGQVHDAGHGKPNPPGRTRQWLIKHGWLPPATPR